MLDPDPLLNVAEKSFAAQRENLRSMAGVMQQGVALGEMIGARQQLGRVKAGLSELNVDDPLFAQKYSSLVAENPLAFTNERIAPVTKAAITPVLASAAQAMESRAALERAKVMAGYQQQLAATRYGYDIGKKEWERDHPKPATPRQPGFAERLITGQVQLAPQGGSPPAAGQSAAPPPAPFSSPSGEDLTDPAPGFPGELPTKGDLPSNSGVNLSNGQPVELLPDEGLIMGEGSDDDNTSPLLNTTAYPPGVFPTALGPVKIESMGEGITLSPFVRATRGVEQVPGYMDIPKEVNAADGTAASRQYVQIPESILKQRAEVYDALIDTDPGIAALNQNAALLGETYKAAKDSLTYLPEDKKGAAAEALVPQAAAAAIATSAAAAAKAQAKVQMLAGEFPEAAAIYNARAREAQANALPEYGPKMEDLLSGGAPARPAPPPSLSVREQLAQAQPNPERQVWDQEKRFALNQAKDLALRLGLREDAIIEAFEKDDKDSINLVKKTAAERGVVSPLLSETMTVLPTPSVRPGFGSPGRPVASPARGWARSKKLNRTYGEILQIAAKDPNYKAFRGETRAKRGYSIEPIVETK